MTEETIKQVVEDILKEYPPTRDDDFLLCVRVYIRMKYARNIKDTIQIDLKKIEFAPAFETITRIRREIQNEEKRFLPSEETQQRRILNEIKTHSKYSTKSMNPNTYPSTLW